jgi:very-short-patch-repair endonuclease
VNAPRSPIAPPERSGTRLESDSERRYLLHAAGWSVVHVTARMLREQPEHVVGLVRAALHVDVSHEQRD